MLRCLWARAGGLTRTVAFATIAFAASFAEAGFTFELGPGTAGFGPGFNSNVEGTGFSEGASGGSLVNLTQASTPGFSAQYVLEVGDTATVSNFGVSLTFHEQKISAAEVSAIAGSYVTATLNFVNPDLDAIFGSVSVQGFVSSSSTGTSDPDLTITWNQPLTGKTFTFSGAASFTVKLNNITFVTGQETLPVSGTLTLNALPEPGSMAIAGMGVIGLAGALRRKRKNASSLVA